MSNLQTPFRYDFVGSFLRPEKLKKARRQFNEGKIDAAALKKVEDEAITELVSKIKELGYPVKLDTNGGRPARLRALAERGTR